MNKPNYKIGLALLALALFTTFAFGQEPAPAPTPSTAPQWLLDLVTKYPWVTTVLVVMGALRFFFKPVWSLIHAWAEKNPDSKLHKFMDTSESSQWWKWLCYVLDWVGSVKISNPAVTPTPTPTVTPK